MFVISENIDECVGVNCFNGECLDLVNGYSCECFTGYIDSLMFGLTFHCSGKRPA